MPWNRQAQTPAAVAPRRRAVTKSEAVLTGRIFDDRGNRMSPSHARKGGIKYRYYLSSALFQAEAERAGSVDRARMAIPAQGHIERRLPVILLAQAALSAGFQPFFFLSSSLIRF